MQICLWILAAQNVKVLNKLARLLIALIFLATFKTMLVVEQNGKIKCCVAWLKLLATDCKLKLYFSANKCKQNSFETSRKQLTTK